MNASKNNPFILLDTDRKFFGSIEAKFIEPLELAHAGNGYDWIADQLKIPLGTVKSRINRAREKIILMRITAQKETV